MFAISTSSRTQASRNSWRKRTFRLEGIGLLQSAEIRNRNWRETQRIFQLELEAAVCRVLQGCQRCSISWCSGEAGGRGWGAEADGGTVTTISLSQYMSWHVMNDHEWSWTSWMHMNATSFCQVQYVPYMPWICVWVVYLSFVVDVSWRFASRIRFINLDLSSRLRPRKPAVLDGNPCSPCSPYFDVF